MELFGFFIPQEMMLFCSLVLCLLSFLFAFIGMIISSKLNRRYKKIMRDGAGRDIAETITRYYDRCTDIVEDYKRADARLVSLEKESRASVKKVGAIRYNAFGGNNGNLSFAAAVLDESDTGFVLNGVYTRQQTTTYLKPIHKGISDFELSEEEEEAIRTAKDNYEKNIQKF